MLLQAKSHKGKNIIARLGNVWEILDKHRNKLLICPKDEKNLPPLQPHARWIDSHSDIDFTIIE